MWKIIFFFLKDNQWHLTDNLVNVQVLRRSGHKVKVIEPHDFYLFDPRFKFSIGLEQCLNPHAVTRGVIDLGIREDLMQISKSGFTDC